MGQRSGALHARAGIREGRSPGMDGRRASWDPRKSRGGLGSRSSGTPRRQPPENDPRNSSSLPRVAGWATRRGVSSVAAKMTSSLVKMRSLAGAGFADAICPGGDRFDCTRCCRPNARTRAAAAAASDPPAQPAMRRKVNRPSWRGAWGRDRRARLIPAAKADAAGPESFSSSARRACREDSANRAATRARSAGSRVPAAQATTPPASSGASGTDAVRRWYRLARRLSESVIEITKTLLTQQGLEFLESARNQLPRRLRRRQIRQFDDLLQRKPLQVQRQ